jgi:F-type H+-transporting ATPase subunit b
MERTQREIDAEMRRALDQLRQEVADLTVMATERIARKTLDDEDHRRLIQEALEEADFSMLGGDEDGRNGARSEEREEAGA